MNARVSIIVEGTVEGNRAWPAVPDQGHFVEIDDGGGKTIECLVTRVVWRKNANPGDCQVDVHCKRSKR